MIGTLLQSSNTIEFELSPTGCLVLVYISVATT